MRVLLLDEGFMSGTLAVQGLRRAGCRVDVIAATGGTGRCDLGDGWWSLAPRSDDPDLFGVIDAAVRRERYDVVYPVTEPLQWLLWDRAPAWQSLVFPRVAEPSRPARRDKRLMSELVAAAGVPVPPELPAESDAQVSEAVRQLGLPIVIKGSTGRGGNATRIRSSLVAAQRSARQLIRRGVVPFAQKFVPGPTVLAGGLFAEGRPLRFFSGIKTVQCPARVGPAAEITSADDPVLMVTAQQVFAATGVTGLASIDLIRDERGRYQFLELNPRPWGSIAAAASSGVDLWGALSSLWRSERVAPRLEFRPGVRTPVFPLYMLAPSYWRSGRALEALRLDLARALAAARAEPALAGHIVHRLLRVGLNW
jgi:carbamoyl-phosphate synthase large subunit